MSWLAHSIANHLRLDEYEGGAPYDAVHPPEDLPRDSTLSAVDRLSSGDGGGHRDCAGDEEIDGDDNRRGVKEDLSELKGSLARQLWGVASFLAPTPPPLPPPPFLNRRGYEDHESERSVEHGEGDHGQFGPSEDYYTNALEDAIGITEEVLAFAKDIAHHPETWLDFPLSEQEEFDDFDISDAQYKHALAVEHLAPGLAALRIELCTVHMSVGYFWMVYFVLLHSRLNKRDADLLSSSQLARARTMWMHELEKRTKKVLSGLALMSTEPSDSMGQDFITHSNEDGARSGYISEPENKFEKQSIIKEELASQLQEEMTLSFPTTQDDDKDNDDDDDDDWFKDVSDFIGYSDKSVIGNEEDISFSDLEDGLDCEMAVKCRIAPSEENTLT